MNDNRAAFGKLINDHQNKIFHVAMGMLGNRDEALDITQEVFLKAFKSYNDFRFNSSFKTWLIRITINKVKDYIRKEKLKRFLFLKPENSTEKIITMVKDKVGMQFTQPTTRCGPSESQFLCMISSCFLRLALVSTSHNLSCYPSLSLESIGYECFFSGISLYCVDCNPTTCRNGHKDKASSSHNI